MLPNGLVVWWVLHAGKDGLFHIIPPVGYTPTGPHAHLRDLRVVLLDATLFGRTDGIFVRDSSGLQSVDSTHSNAQVPPPFFSQKVSTLNPRVHILEKRSRRSSPSVWQQGPHKDRIAQRVLLRHIYGLRASTWAASTSIWRRNNRLVLRTKVPITLSANARRGLPRLELFAH